MAHKRRAFGTVQPIHSRTPGKPDRFHARYTGPDGIRYSAPNTFTTRGDAEGWLFTVQQQVFLRLWRPPVDGRKPTPVEFGQWAEVCIRNRQGRSVKPLRATTAELYRKIVRRDLLDTFGGRRIDQIRASDVAAWYRAQQARNRPTELGNAYLLLRSLFADAVADGLIDTNPCRVPGAGKPQPKHAAETLTPDELRTYLEAVPERYRLPLMVAAMCGLRSGEVRGLRVRDVDPASGRIDIRQAVSRVGGRWQIGPPKTSAGVRTVYAPQVLRQALADHVAGLPTAIGAGRERLLFTSNDGSSPIRAETLRAAHLRGRKAIDRATLTVHDLRRTAATLAAQEGATTREIMAMLGHVVPTVAMRYQTATDQRMAEIAERMNAAVTR